MSEHYSFLPIYTRLSTPSKLPELKTFHNSNVSPIVSLVKLDSRKWKFSPVLLFFKPGLLLSLTHNELSKEDLIFHLPQPSETNKSISFALQTLHVCCPFRK